jgi:hypothetical protein
LSLAVVVEEVLLPNQHHGVFRFTAVEAGEATANGQISLSLLQVVQPETVSTQ